MAIYRRGRALTPREQAERVRDLTGWTRKEYKREYDKWYNRVRNYERITGAPRGSISAPDTFARYQINAANARKYGQSYTPPHETQAIMAAPSSSVSARISTRRAAETSAIAIEEVKKQFAGLIEKSQIARDALRALYERTPQPSAYQIRDALQFAARTSDAVREAQKAYNRTADITEKIYIDESP